LYITFKNTFIYINKRVKNMKKDKKKFTSLGIGGLIMTTSLLLSGCNNDEENLIETSGRVITPNSTSNVDNKEIINIIKENTEENSDLVADSGEEVEQTGIINIQDSVDITLIAYDNTDYGNVSIYASAMPTEDNGQTIATTRTTGTSMPDVVPPIVYNPYAAQTASSTPDVIEPIRYIPNNSQNVRIIGGTPVVSTPPTEIVPPIKYVPEKDPAPVYMYAAMQETITPVDEPQIALYAAAPPEIGEPPIPEPMPVVLYAAYMEEPEIEEENIPQIALYAAAPPTPEIAEPEPMPVVLYAAYMEEPEYVEEQQIPVVLYAAYQEPEEERP
jgi:hypothetical protein